jgi:hypothetical protein
MTSQTSPSTIFVTHRITPIYVFSLVIAILMTVTSAAGLLFHTNIYPTADLLKTFLSNDVVNLFIGLPILLGSMELARRGKLIGLLLWPGALFYVFYNYLVYLFGMPLNALTLVYLVLVTSSAYTTIRLVADLDGKAIQQRLSGVAPVRFAGGVLVGFGVLFFLRAIGVLVNSITHQTPVGAPELALQVADLVTTPAWVIAGILLWRRRTLGYVTGLGFLFQASTLFIGLLILMGLQPFLTSTPFVLTDALVIFCMGLVCFIPLGLFVRRLLAIS